MTTAVEFKNVDIIFGDRSKEALAMARAGEDRSVILAKTGAVLGATGANLTVNEGEISVLMGLSGSGKSTLLRAVNGLNKVTGGQVLVKDGEPHGRCRLLRRGNAPPYPPEAGCDGVPAVRPAAMAHGARERRLRA
jgi:ABC-type proline/glycine betaine transport system ATPase subunit